MRILLWIVLALTAVFAALNWPAFNAPQPLWIGFATITAPLGVLMLGALTVIVVLLLVEQTTALTEARRYSREIDNQRKLADRAEASRFTELRAYLSEELARADQRTHDTQTALASRIDALERTMRAALEQAETNIATYVGQRVERRVEGVETVRR
jgi:membrane protein implicated in regulation of membrane protease activity